MAYTIFVDFETSGLELHHPPIQLASIVVDDNWNECASFEAKLKFDESLADPEALKMNHYDRAVWEREAIFPTLAVSRFIAYTKPYLSIQMISKRTGNPYMVGKLAGHNALTFDLPILRRLFGQTFFPFSYHVKDTLQRAVWFYDEHPELPRPENLKLSTLCQSLGINCDGAHDALVDVRMSAALARKFAEIDGGRKAVAA